MRSKLLILFLFFSCATFAQDSIKLHTETAKRVVKDLIEGDYCEKELTQTKILVRQLEKKVGIQDTIIKTHKERNILQKELVISKDKQIDILETQNKQQKNKTFWTKVALYGSIALNIFLGIKSL